MRDIRRIAVSDNLAVILCSRITISDSEPVDSIENLGMTEVILRDMRRRRRGPVIPPGLDDCASGFFSRMFANVVW